MYSSLIIIIITVLRPFFHTEARVGRYQQLNSIFAYSVRPPFLGLTFSCLLPHTHSCLLTPTLLYATCHLQIPALRNPVITLFTFHLPVSSQPVTTDDTINAFDTQPTPELFTCSSVLKGHSRHPPNHTIFRSHKSLHIICLHRPSFTAIHKHPLYTRSIYLSLHSQGGLPAVSSIFRSLNFLQAHLTLALDDSSTPPPFPITSPK